MRKVGIVILGVVAGAAAAYIASQKREEILRKLNEIQSTLERMELKEKARTTVNELVQKVKNLVRKGEELTVEEKEKMLAEIEEKIQRLEEAIKG